MNKTEMIEALVNDDIDTINSGEANDYLDSILRDGFCGYRNQTFRQLKQECQQRFGVGRC